MKHQTSRKWISILLIAVLFISMVPAAMPIAHAGHTCPDCGEWIDGSPYCEDCYKCTECCALCLECGKCAECSGWEICEDCSDDNGDTICTDCAIDKGSHCPDCYECYYIRLWCDECGRCSECVDNCEGCTAYLGEGVICVECALEKDAHCPECEQCYFGVQGWCEECKKCEDCCPRCDFCTEEEGVLICTECAVENNLHCPDCTECYGESNGEYCMDCDVCANCKDYCGSCELCIECAIDSGFHCPDCYECADNIIICEDCGEKCIGCADAFCENCNLCSDCVEVCPDCGACSNCADICLNCGEYCSECEGVCDDCGFCLICCMDFAAFEGCDCSNWVCVENEHWEEHFEEVHASSADSHAARPVSGWSWDNTYHWNRCHYCEDSSHFRNKDTHSFDAKDNCTTCGYVRNSKIQILKQPEDVKYVRVQSAYEDYDEGNIAHFSVEAVGESALTYIWCRKYTSGGQTVYKPLSEYGEPTEDENYEGPNLDFIVHTDACYTPWTICCIITDEDGNEAKTQDAVLSATHDYHYYESFKSHERPCALAERSKNGHVLECVGEGCDKTTHLLLHEDGDADGYCDICDYEMPPIMITKQPSNIKNVYVSSPDEDYDESNIAHATIEAIGEGELTYTWCRTYLKGGQWVYDPFDEEPWEGENFEGPNLSFIAPEDSCSATYYYCCFVEDEAGNKVKSNNFTLQAKHNYQYYKYYQSHTQPLPYAEKRYIGHYLQCVGQCGTVTRMRSHQDEDRDYICDICDLQKDMYDPVGIFVTAPKEGNTPSYTVTADRPCYAAVGNSTNYTNHRFWYVSDNGINNWQLMTPTTPFIAGKYYKVSIEMQTASGYEFSPMVSYDGEEPYFWAEVNGNSTKAHATAGKDPKHYATIHYVFGECNDSVIEKIVIDGVTEPVAGERPSYTATVRGSGYYIDSSKNAQLDDYWNNPQQKPYYIKNGIGWFDLTEFDWVYENETFIAGHEYQPNIYLRTEEGYTFYHDKWYDMLFTASVNGTAAEGNTTTSAGLYEQTISADFNCKPAEIALVMLSNIDQPRANQQPDYTPTIAHSYYYMPDPNYGTGGSGIYWFDSEESLVEEGEAFRLNETYHMEIKLIPRKENGAAICKFITPLTAYLNGRVVEADDVYASANAVYIYYTFPPATGIVFPDFSEYDIPAGQGGTRYCSKKDFGATGGTEPYTFSLESGPSWLKISANGKGLTGMRPLNGAKATTATVRVTDSTGQFATISIGVGAVAAAANPFQDVGNGWAYKGILYSYYNGYMEGTSKNPMKFSPNMEFTREQFVQLLFNMEGKKKSDYKGDTGFSDVPSGKWYSAAVKWAKAEGITTGIGGGKFGLGNKVTREQLAQFMKNYADYRGEDTSARADLSVYEDQGKISKWAKTSMRWAAAVGLLGNTSANNTKKTISPQRVALRSEVAKIVMSYDDFRF